MSQPQVFHDDQDHTASQLEKLADLLDSGLMEMPDIKQSSSTARHFSQGSRGITSSGVRRIQIPITSPEEEDSDSEVVHVVAEGIMKPLLGGKPITIELAKSLRHVVLGSSVQAFSASWRRANLLFHPVEGAVPWGLTCSKTPSRVVVICIQAAVLKHLLFSKEEEDVNYHRCLSPSSYARREALVGAITDSLWRAGGGKCVVCLPDHIACFTSSQYTPDGFTEKLHLFDFTSFENLAMFIKRYLSYFESANTQGCVLLLYSLVLSRTIQRVLEDMGQSAPELPLLEEGELCTQALISLLLVGKAVCYTHNGDVIYNSNGDTLEKSRKGIPQRGDVGLLHWNRKEEEDKRTQIGSMLKTPRCPIWVTLVNGSHAGVLFCPRRDLVTDWRTEHRFTLHYYNGLLQPLRDTKLTIDTRSAERHLVKNSRTRDEEQKIPSLERCIQTKWHGSAVDWQGSDPYY